MARCLCYAVSGYNRITVRQIIMISLLKSQLLLLSHIVKIMYVINNANNIKCTLKRDECRYNIFYNTFHLHVIAFASW